MASTSLGTPTPYMFCGECGGSFSSQDLARFGNHYVCPNCKPGYVQRMREGVQPMGGTLTGVHYGGFWIRVLAILIDMLILWAITIPLSFVVGIGGAMSGFNPQNPDFSKLFAVYSMLAGIGLVFALLYQGYFVSQKGGTPGKLALGLRIVNVDGSNLSVLKAIGRYFAYMLSAFTLYIGYIIAAFDSEKRALHDHICSTRVIYKR